MITRVRLTLRHHREDGPPRQAPEQRPDQRQRPETPQSPQPPTGWRRWIGPGLSLLVLLLFVVLLTQSDRGAPSLAYSEFVNRVESGRVKSVSINDQGAVDGTLRNGDDFTTQVPTSLNTSDLERRLRDKGVKITATQSDQTGVGGVLLGLAFFLLPVLLLIGFFLWMGRRAARGLTGGISAIGRSRAKLIETERPTTRFDDIAGYDGVKQEVSEVVDFLRRPERYAAAGARGPRGVLMVGPPGTGKTLLARAVAGEARVAFLSVTGSGFVEMFVGVGASRVRDLFAEAGKRAPSIIFIDEIDALGSRQAGTRPGGNDEREQTLNQLLSEMDGFDPRSGIVVLAATNRPEALDTALLRPGRFDRRVTVPLPNQAERAAILRVHARDKNVAPGVDFDTVARATPGFSGADLANLVNEAAINAVRAARNALTAADLDAARDRVLLGRRDASAALLPEERRSIAVHESGHALTAALCPHADPVAKVTILPAGPALGVTEQLPESERHLYSESYLTDLLTVRLGGRAAELVVFGEGSTGAVDDLAGATQLATRMVREFGLSSALGPVGYAAGTPRFLGGENAPDALGRPYSEQTQRAVDQEVSRLLQEAEDRAVSLLRTHRPALERLAEQLVSEETVDGSAVTDALRAEPEPSAGTERPFEERP